MLPMPTAVDQYPRQFLAIGSDILERVGKTAAGPQWSEVSDDTIITLAFCLCGLSHMADHTMMNAPLSADVKERPILFNAAMVRAV